MSDLDVKKLREQLGMSQESFARMLGVHTRTIQNWESGTTIPDSKRTKLRAISSTGTVGTEAKHGNLIPYYDDVSTIGGVNESGADMGNISSPNDYIDTGDWFRDATAAIRHYGDSMTEYPNGCILAIREVIDRGLVVPGRDYVIETSEYRVTKRIQSGKDEQHFTAYSTNQEKYADGHLIHEPFDIPKDAIRHMFLVLGYVVKKNGGTLVYSNKK